MKSIFIFLNSIGIIFFFIIPPVFASKLAVTSEIQEININQEIEVSIFLNTEGQTINALEGIVTFSTDLLDIKEIRDGDSIVNLWIKRPSFENKTEIAFAGGIPGGYISEKGKIFGVVFETKNEGKAQIAIKNARVLRSDGKGTEDKVTIVAYTLEITPGATLPENNVPEITDFYVPEAFETVITKDENLYEGKYVAVFETQDKQSGIDHYEIKEGNGNFIPAESPYVLKNQNVDEYVVVRAIDKKGNTRENLVNPLKQKEKTASSITWITSLLISALIFSIFIRLYQNQKKSHF